MNTAISISKPENKQLQSRALALIARRDFTRAEFIKKLLDDGFEKPEIEGAADWCESLGWLNESRYVEGAARRLSAKFGASSVARKLKEKGVSVEAIDAAMPELKDNEFERAHTIWLRKFHTPAENANDKAKQIRFLQSRGFNFSVIKKVISGANDDE